LSGISGGIALMYGFCYLIFIAIVIYMIKKALKKSD